jgi:hypothetical protein
MKILITLMLTICVLGFTQAQGLRFGLKIGGNWSALVKNTEPEEGSARTTFATGVVVNIPVSQGRHLSCQPELLYAGKGYQILYPYGGYTSMKEIRLHYVDVLLPFQRRFACWHSKRWETISLAVEAGPELAYLLGAQYRDDTRRDPATWRYQRWDVGYLAGVGVQFGQKLGWGVRYNGGLRNVYSGQYIQTYPKSEAYNSAIQVQVTYYLGKNSWGSAPE